MLQDDLAVEFLFGVFVVRGWLAKLTNVGNPHGTIADPTAFITGSVICPKQTTGVAASVHGLNGYYATTGGQMRDIAFAELGTNGSVLNISSISAATNNSPTGPGSTVTVTTTTPHGITIGAETGSIVAGVTPSYTISSETQGVGIETVTATTSGAHGMTLPMQNVDATVASAGISGYNGTHITISAVGPCESQQQFLRHRHRRTGWRHQRNDNFYQRLSTVHGGYGWRGHQHHWRSLGRRCLNTTIAGYMSVTQIALTSCGAGCSSSSAHGFSVDKALLNTQFQYIAAQRGSFTDGVTNGTTTFTSATANFATSDVGAPIAIAGGLAMAERSTRPSPHGPTPRR